MDGAVAGPARRASLPFATPLTKNPVKNRELLAELREIEAGKWQKVRRDGWSKGERVSLHYFESASGMVFNFKVKSGWSNG